MAYDQALAGRVRNVLGDPPDLQEKKMFGGVGFLLNGNLACGVNGNDLIVRVGPEKNAAALAEPFTRPFDMTGRPMAGWVMVAPQGCSTDESLGAWIEAALAFVRTLPAK